jgi:hypothetical protein
MTTTKSNDHELLPYSWLTSPTYYNMHERYIRLQSFLAALLAHTFVSTAKYSTRHIACSPRAFSSALEILVIFARAFRLLLVWLGFGWLTHRACMAWGWMLAVFCLLGDNESGRKGVA